MLVFKDCCATFVVPYIHCYCHRLKFVVDELLKTVVAVADHFSTLFALYEFFKLNEVRKLYEGDTLKRLIDTRWSGHFNSIEVVFNGKVNTTSKEQSHSSLKLIYWRL